MKFAIRWASSFVIVIVGGFIIEPFAKLACVAMLAGFLRERNSVDHQETINDGGIGFKLRPRERIVLAFFRHVHTGIQWGVPPISISNHCA